MNNRLFNFFDGINLLLGQLSQDFNDTPLAVRIVLVSMTVLLAIVLVVFFIVCCYWKDQKTKEQPLRNHGDDIKLKDVSEEDQRAVKIDNEKEINMSREIKINNKNDIDCEEISPESQYSTMTGNTYSSGADSLDNNDSVTVPDYVSEKVKQKENEEIHTADDKHFQSPNDDGSEIGKDITLEYSSVDPKGNVEPCRESTESDFEDIGEEVEAIRHQTAVEEAFNNYMSAMERITEFSNPIDNQVLKDANDEQIKIAMTLYQEKLNNVVAINKTNLEEILIQKMDDHFQSIESENNKQWIKACNEDHENAMKIACENYKKEKSTDCDSA